MKFIIDLISFLSDFLTVIASGIAIFLFIFKRETISNVIKVLLNYSTQITLSELKSKIDKLNDLTMREPTHIDEIHCLFHDISGQMKGNKNLHDQCSGIIEKIDIFIADYKKMNEPRKRSLVSELRESLRNIDVSNIESIIGGK